MKRLTVSYVPRAGARRREGEVPLLRLRGKWLQSAGFTIGTRYTARVEHGNLILSPLHEAATL